MYDGLALGGPLDGKRITHESPYYRAAEQNQLMPSFVSFEATMSITDMTYDIFRYVHFKTPGGNVWIPEEVERGRAERVRRPAEPPEIQCMRDEADRKAEPDHAEQDAVDRPAHLSCAGNA